MNLRDKVLYKIGKPLSRLFVAGDTMEDALRIAKELNEQGLEAIINFLGEEAEDQRQVYDVARIYSQLVWEIQNRDIGARVSIKPSHLGLKVYPYLYWNRLLSIAGDCFSYKVPLEIDMETEDMAAQTTGMAIQLAKHYPGLDLRQCLAMNFKDSFAYLYNLTAAGVKVRLCKGAYPSKYREKEVKERYLTAAYHLFQKKADPDFATHDLELLNRIHSNYRKARTVCGFQFLFGLRRSTWKELSEQNRRVAIYVPFGTNWLPYAKRRWKYIIKKTPSIICGN